MVTGFLKDKEFNGFYHIGLIAIQNTQLLFMDAQGAAILIDTASVHTVSELTGGKQTGKLPPLFTGRNVPQVRDYFLNRKCDIKLKQTSPLLGFSKPGGLYAVLVTGISDEAVTAQDPKGNKRMAKMPDVLFIQECL